MNKMKIPECRICGRTLENSTYDEMMAHVQKHLLDKEQTTFEDYTN